MKAHKAIVEKKTECRGCRAPLVLKGKMIWTCIDGSAWFQDVFNALEDQGYSLYGPGQIPFCSDDCLKKYDTREKENYRLAEIKYCREAITRYERKLKELEGNDG